WCCRTRYAKAPMARPCAASSPSRVLGVGSEVARMAGRLDMDLADRRSLEAADIEAVRDGGGVAAEHGVHHQPGGRRSAGDPPRTVAGSQEEPAHAGDLPYQRPAIDGL